MKNLFIVFDSSLMVMKNFEILARLHLQGLTSAGDL